MDSNRDNYVNDAAANNEPSVRSCHYSKPAIPVCAQRKDLEEKPEHLENEDMDQDDFSDTESESNISQLKMEYCSGDFYSGDDSPNSEFETTKATNKSSEISDNSSEDDDDEKLRPWKHTTTRKTMHQTKLNFAQGAHEAKTKRYSLRGNFSDQDTEMYRKGYPGLKDDPSLNNNAKFYRGEIPSQPDGDFIDNIHRKWRGNYKLLERHHGYIQWLFPIREPGMNYHAQTLQLHEAEEIKHVSSTSMRVLESYKLMLDFYGMKLVDDDSGEISRSANWRKCFENLNWSTHNHLRITRILKSLGELGFEDMKKPFLEFILKEALVKNTLTNTVRSCRDFWIGTVKDDKERMDLYRFLEG